MMGSPALAEGDPDDPACLHLVPADGRGPGTEEPPAQRALDLHHVTVDEAAGGPARAGGPAGDVDGVDPARPTARSARDDDPQLDHLVPAWKLPWLGPGAEAADQSHVVDPLPRH